MAKNHLQSALHQPLTAILGTRAKIAALRVLLAATTDLPYREVVRRCGMAYGSVDLAISELTASGIVIEVPGGRERRVRLQATHRLMASVSALLRAEQDFFPALRVALVTAIRPLERDGLISASMVGAAARREEQVGDPVELVVIVRDSAALTRCHDRLAAESDGFAARFGVAIRVIGYDQDTARAMWRKRIPAAVESVGSAELLVGEPLAGWLAQGGE